VIGVPGARGRGGPPTTIPAGSFSTTLGLHGPESNKRAVTPIITKAAIIGQLILLIEFSPGQKSNLVNLTPRRGKPRIASTVGLSDVCIGHITGKAMADSRRRSSKFYATGEGGVVGVVNPP
jgi:hypothetical protein